MKSMTEAAQPAGAHNAAAEAARDGSSPAGCATARRRGTTSLLAVLYLILFSSIALAFYAQTRAL